MHNKYEVKVAVGIEADDLLALDQRDDTVICTRDKDLRMIPGWHYGWECGQQREEFLHQVTHDGELWLDGNKLRGNGMSFFYAQLLMGDTVDNIPGCPGIGPKKAYNALKDQDIHHMFHIVRSFYEYEYEDTGDERMLEQGRLLWMTRELNPDGTPVLWSFPN
jgi:5'-3' exonuclease